jgi:hypothetical protein
VLIRIVVHGYTLLLRLYPRRFRQEFADEMQAVFTEAMTEAAARGRLGVFFLRELRDAPQSIARAYWYGWTKKWQEGAKLIREAAAADLPPPPPDGRESWRQVGLELSLFLIAGLLLILVTYLPLDGLSASWQRNLEILGRVITPLTLPVFLIGLARGLPRWAYPSGGLLLSYHALTAYQSGVLPFLIAMLLASAILAAMAIITDAQHSSLPAPLRRIGQSLSLDWTRLSFGIYGALPLAIISAFDDAHFNNRTPYLAVSVLVMVVFALIYCRSRQSTVQIAALLGGMSLSIWAAFLDEASFAGGLGDWIATPRPAAAETLWTLELWILWLALILAPALLTMASRAVRPGRVV